MRRWMALGGWLVAAALALGGCSTIRTTPRIEPIEAFGGDGNTYSTKIEASTNCAEIGEEVIFRTEITNRSTQSITVTGDPLIDFIIEPAGQRAGLPQRWSDSTEYPHPGTIVLLPQESTAYRWEWVADAQYGSGGAANTNGVQVYLHWVIQTRPGGTNGVVESPSLVVGVHSHPRLGNGGILCSRMDR